MVTWLVQMQFMYASSQTKLYSKPDNEHTSPKAYVAIVTKRALWVSLVCESEFGEVSQDCEDRVYISDRVYIIL